MDKQSQLYILLCGFLGLMLATLISRPREVKDAIVAVMGGLFGSLVIAPAFAEVLTNASLKFSALSWLDASPGTALFASIVGLGGMLGFQIVVTVKADFVEWLKKFAKIRLKVDE